LNVPGLGFSEEVEDEAGMLYTKISRTGTIDLKGITFAVGWRDVK